MAFGLSTAEVDLEKTPNTAPQHTAESPRGSEEETGSETEQSRSQLQQKLFQVTQILIMYKYFTLKQHDVTSHP